ncbi:MAG: hypothetical protein J6Y89_06750 [Lachnospiraceae bacterium]|nr:hypothetical protein [Lachnospiraceae bacterium]
MNGSVILQSPVLLVLYGIALVSSIICRFKKTGIVLPVTAAILVVGTSAYALLAGVSYLETAIAIAVFLIVGLAGKKEEAL